MKHLQLLSLLWLLMLGGVQPEHVKCSKYHISSALQSSANCQPRDKIIRLDPPGNMTADTMTPNYIQVKRCGGACSSTSQSCVPTRKRPRKVSVIVGRCGVESGICSKECFSLSVQEDLECKCDCLQQQRECGPGKLFMSDTCSCRCENLEAAKKCKDAGRVWDTKDCTCGCPAHTVVQCTTGLTFDNATCTCADPIYSIISTAEKVESESRVSRSNTILGNKEMMVIAILSGVLVVSIMVSVLLVRHVYVLRVRLKEVLLENKKDNTDSYIPCANPSPGDLKLKQFSYQSDSATPLLVDMCTPSDSIYADLRSRDVHNVHIMPNSRSANVNQFCLQTEHSNNTSTQHHFSRLGDLPEETVDQDVSDSVDSSISRGESGFESGNVSEPGKVFGIDSLSIINNRLRTPDTSGSNPSIFSRGSVETSV